MPFGSPQIGMDIVHSPLIQRADGHVQIIACIKDGRIAGCKARMVVQTLRQELFSAAKTETGVARERVRISIK